MLYATVRQRKIHVKNPVTVIRNGVGVDQLMLDLDEEWKDMSSIVCVFTLHYTTKEEQTQTVEKEDGTQEEVTKTVTVEKEIAKELLHSFGEPVPVPWECLTETGELSINCTGYVGEEKVMTTMLADSFWNVVQNGPTTGEAPEEATLSLYEQILGAAGEAKTAARTANTVAVELQSAKERGEFDGNTPTVTVGRVTEGQRVQVTNSGTPQAAVFDFVLPRGPEGRAGKDAEVTMENINAALGYAPAPWPAVDHKVQLPSGEGDRDDYGFVGQFAVSDGKGGITWLSLTNVGEVGA